MTRLRTVPVDFIAAWFLTASVPVSQTPATYKNGRWFDSTTFIERVTTVAGGRLSLAPVDSSQSSAGVIDLGGGYVIPPFCEGHNHNIAVGRPEERNAKYVSAGVFYALILNDAST